MVGGALVHLLAMQYVSPWDNFFRLSSQRKHFESGSLPGRWCGIRTEKDVECMVDGLGVDVETVFTNFIQQMLTTKTFIREPLIAI